MAFSILSFLMVAIEGMSTSPPPSGFSSCISWIAAATASLRLNSRVAVPEPSALMSVVLWARKQPVRFATRAAVRRQSMIRFIGIPPDGWWPGLPPDAGIVAKKIVQHCPAGQHKEGAGRLPSAAVRVTQGADRLPPAPNRETRAMTAIPACFKAYDIRGRVPEELNADLAYRIGLATAAHLGGRRFAVGRDCRLSSGELCAALVRGLNDAGADVVDIGLCGTEMVYYATAAGPGRRHHGHRQPQPHGLQRDEAGARRCAAHQRGLRAATRSGPWP